MPGFILAGLYIVYVVGRAMINPKLAPTPPELATSDAAPTRSSGALLTSFFPLAILILSVLGAIIFGLATPSEAAAVGASAGSCSAAGYRALDFPAAEGGGLSNRTHVCDGVLTCSSAPGPFSSVFAYLGGHEVVENWFKGLNIEPDRLPDRSPSSSSSFSAGRSNGRRSSSFSCRSSCRCSRPSTSTRCCSGFWSRSTSRLRSIRRRWPWQLLSQGVAPPQVRLTQIFGGALPFVFMVFLTMALVYIFPDSRSGCPASSTELMLDMAI